MLSIEAVTDLYFILISTKRQTCLFESLQWDCWSCAPTFQSIRVHFTQTH